MTLYTLWIKNFVKIALISHRFVQSGQTFKVATKNGRKTIFGKIVQVDSVYTLETKNLAKIALSYTIYEIN